MGTPRTYSLSAGESTNVVRLGTPDRRLRLLEHQHENEMRSFAPHLLFIAVWGCASPEGGNLLSASGSAPISIGTIFSGRAEAQYEGVEVIVRGRMRVDPGKSVCMWDKSAHQDPPRGLTIYAPGGPSTYRQFNNKEVIVRGVFKENIAKGRVDFNICDLSGLVVREVGDIQLSGRE